MIIGITLFLLLINSNITISLQNSFNNIIYVDDDNIDGPWDGSYDYPFEHIQDAINVSQSFDTIFVRNGTYLEYLTITKEIYLIGEDNTNTIIQSTRLEEESQFNRIITIYADNVQVKNLCIKPYNNISTNNVNAIYAENSSELIIQNNNIINCYNAILFVSNSSAEILDNHIQFYNEIPLRCIYFINPPEDSVITISGNNIISYGEGINFNFFKTAPSEIIIIIILLFHITISLDLHLESILMGVVYLLMIHQSIYS